MSKENSKNAHSINVLYKDECKNPTNHPATYTSQQKLKIVLIGYGKMGKEIEYIIKQYDKQNHECNDHQSKNSQHHCHNSQNPHPPRIDQKSQSYQSFSNIEITSIIDSNESFQKYIQEYINNTNNIGNVDNIESTQNTDNIQYKTNTDSTVFIDFSTAYECEFRINTLLQNGCKVVSGTTGWNVSNIEKNFHTHHVPYQTDISFQTDTPHKPHASDTLHDLHITHASHNPNQTNNHNQIHNQSIYPKNATFLHSSNFSLGVNLFWNIIQHASQIFSGISEYDIKGNEVHHIHKKDAPSGTAITTQKIISQNANRKIDPFSYERTGDVCGVHEVNFESNEDTIKISHEAKSRKAFAIGAIKVAQWINNKNGLLNINDYIQECYKK